MRKTTKSHPKGTCKMTGCHDPAKITGLCSACYSWLHYWQKKTPRQVMARIAAVERAELRLGTIAPATRLSKQRRRA